MSEEKEPMIIKKMLDIMAEIGPIKKDKLNTMQKFKYRGIDDVYNAVHDIMVKHRVFCRPYCRDLRTETLTNKDGKIKFRSLVIMDFNFVAEDGSSICVSTPGEGVDSADKATGKAVSYADKDAFLKAFKIPTEDGSPDPDKDDIDNGDLSGNPIAVLRKRALEYVDKQAWPTAKMDVIVSNIERAGVEKGYLEMVIEGRVK